MAYAPSANSKKIILRPLYARAGSAIGRWADWYKERRRTNAQARFTGLFFSWSCHCFQELRFDLFTSITALTARFLCIWVFMSGALPAEPVNGRIQLVVMVIALLLWPQIKTDKPQISPARFRGPLYIKKNKPNSFSVFCRWNLSNHFGILVLPFRNMSVNLISVFHLN